MNELLVTGIKKYMEATLILKDINFQVYSGEKVGIVGANGSGKTTILKLIAGIEPMNYCVGYPGATSPGYDEGFISITRGATCAYLEQVPNYDENLKVIDILNLAFEEVHAIELDMRSLETEMKTLDGVNLERALKRYSDLVQLFEVKGGYEIEEKLGKICTGLKFDSSFLNKEFNLLSGGEKTTVILGKLLIDNPDVLLLDEPTNHLDMNSIEWLEGYLKNYKGIVIIVSHDRYFLDNVVTKIVELEDMISKTYKGNYSAFINQKEEDMRIQFENFKEQQKKVNAMEETIKNLRDWAMRADNNKFFRRAASMQKSLDKMEKIDKPMLERQNMKLTLKGTQRSGNETIKAVNLTKKFDEKVIFKNANMLINYGERVGLIGENGSGKTTFLKMLLGEDIPDDGVVELGASVKAAYLPQQIYFENEELTVLECFREDVSILEGKGREYLSKFMFYGNSVFKKVKHLSGGEKIRLKLSKLLYEDINLLILDEPTNHLDIDSIETLEEALEEFKGTIFFVSHDRYFINKISERVIAIEETILKSYPGNYDYYKEIRTQRELKAVKEQEVVVKKVKKPRVVDENKKREAEKAKIERNIVSLEEEIAVIDLEMTDTAKDYEELHKLYCRKEELTKELEKAMEIWVDLEG
ncbi:MAG: ABC-F type ribosomal protection protein [Clostridium sp.]